MKTTLELADAVFEELKAAASQDGIPMRSIVEDALRREFERRRTAIDGFELADHSAGSGWLTSEFSDGSLQDAIDASARS